MFTKERNIIKDRIDSLSSRKENITAEIQRQNNIYDNICNIIDKYESCKSAKRFLIKIIKFLLVYYGALFLICFIFPTFFLIEKGQELLTFLYFTVLPSLLMSYYCIDKIRIIIKNKGIKENDYNKSLQEANEKESEIAKLKNNLSSLDNEIKNNENIIKSIDYLNNNIRNILSLGEDHQYLISDDVIKVKLLVDFEDYLNEPIDYSKVSLEPQTILENIDVKKLVRK